MGIFKYYGMVVNCASISIFERPDAESPILYRAVCQTELLIDREDSTEDFYKVVTAAGIVGYCMKDFVTVQP